MDLVLDPMCGHDDNGMTPTFMLTYWTRDRTRVPRLPLEHVVHRTTRQSAEMCGLRDRGPLAPGYRADVNVIDLDALGFGPRRMVHDLPAGARWLVRWAHGCVDTNVAGTRTLERDEPAGAFPDRLVRGPR